MGQLVLLVVAAAWAAVLIPPLLRSRLENRPNSSVSDFRNQLSSLQRAMPTRGGMRTMARPLAPSPLTRPAAPGRPALRSGVRTHGTPVRHPAHATRAGRTDASSPRAYEASARSRSHSDRHRQRSHRAVEPGERPYVSPRETMKRRRANVLFLLVLVAGCSLFLAATTKAEAMLYTFVLTFMALCGYVYLLGQLRQRERVAEPVPMRRPQPPARRRVEHWAPVSQAV
jgi:hypothetical protein